jgi:hypothetical protein
VSNAEFEGGGDGHAWSLVTAVAPFFVKQAQPSSTAKQQQWQYYTPPAKSVAYSWW